MPLDPRLFCAVDFGTSNSAIAVPSADAGMSLVTLEAGQVTMPTAVFYRVEGLAGHEPPERIYGRAALAAYLEGQEGRLMRSMKSILGSTLADQSTDVGEGRAVRYRDVIAGYLQRLKTLAEERTGAPLERAVLGRPVFFVDGDPLRDAQAQQALEDAARACGLTEVSFQFEPIAAALDFEQTTDHEALVLVADIGGGTSDFSLVRVGPQRRERLDRRDDILANHGVHIAGTDFDRQVELAAILPACGYRALGPTRADGAPPREVPSRVYFDLATWHLINTVYTAPRRAELQRMKSFYGQPEHHRRLMQVVDERLGHALLTRAEDAKIAVAEGGSASIDLALLAPGLQVPFDAAQALEALDADLDRIAQAVDVTLQMAGVSSEAVEVVYFTGGSTGFAPLTRRIGQRVPAARAVHGDRNASVANGLGVHARRLFQ